MMRLVDVQQQRLLEHLRRAGEQPVALGELRASGVDRALVVSELELSGYAIERVYADGGLIGVRLRDRQPSETPDEDRRGSARRTASPRPAR